jgi:hypothetical protein
MNGIKQFGRLTIFVAEPLTCEAIKTLLQNFLKLRARQQPLPNRVTSRLPVSRPGRSITSGLVDESYSARSASEGDIRLARTAGTNAATSVEKLSVRMARRVVAGSYGFKP